jgi:hypothetical protein
MLLIPEIDQRIEIGDAFGPDIAAASTIAAIRPAELDVFFTPEGNAAISSIAGANIDFCLIEKFHECNAKKKTARTPIFRRETLLHLR